MKKIRVERDDGIFDVLILRHKGTDKFSFVNLTKGHICPCVFNAEAEAIEDLDKYKSTGRIKSYKIIRNEKDNV